MLGLWATGATLFAVAVIARPSAPWGALMGIVGIAAMLGAWIYNVRSGSYGRRGRWLGDGGGGGPVATGDGGVHGHSAGMVGGDGGGGGDFGAGGGDFGGGGYFGGGDFGGGGGGDGGGGG
jgi:hypothetical protein